MPGRKVDMGPGLIPDSGNAIYTDRSAGVQGKTEDSMFTGLKLSGRLVFPITAFRLRQMRPAPELRLRPGQRHGCWHTGPGKVSLRQPRWHGYCKRAPCQSIQQDDEGTTAVQERTRR